MHIDKKLNLVIPVDRDDGSKLYVHSMPISMAVFENYYLVIAKTWAAIYSEGLGYLAGPRIAAMTLKRIAQDLDAWDGPTGVERGLIAEIHRLTSVIVLGSDGWKPIPFHEAMKEGRMDEDEASEVNNALVFFTVAYRMHKKSEREAILQGASRIWGGLTVSSDCMAYATSLKTLTVTESTGEKDLGGEKTQQKAVVTAEGSPVAY